MGACAPVDAGQIGLLTGAVLPVVRHDEAMDRDWSRLAAAVKRRRKELGMTQIGLATAAGVSESTIQLLESGTPRGRMPRSLPAVERELGWAPGSATALLMGGVATPLPDAPQESDADEAPQEPAPRLADGMPVRVRHELSRGRVVDTEVADVSRTGSSSRFILVWKSDEDGGDVSPEELEEWTRVQRLLRDLPTGSDRPEK